MHPPRHIRLLQTPHKVSDGAQRGAYTVTVRESLVLLREVGGAYQHFHKHEYALTLFDSAQRM